MSTRSTRSAALLSVATLAGAALLGLALAPAANADIPAPTLGTLTTSPSAPQAGDLVRVSGTGCIAVPTGTIGNSGPSASAASGATAAAAGASAADATPTAAAADDDGGAGTIAVTITGPDSFQSGDTATAAPDGTWDGVNGVTLGGAGDYTVAATCTLTDPVLGQSVTFDYDALTLTVAAPPQTIDPSVVCTGCDNVNPGGTVTLAGTGFPANATATVALAGYGSKPAPVDANGGFAPVSFVIAANQAPDRLSGGVSAPGAPTQSFSVLVTAPSAPGGSVDGDVPSSGATDGTDNSGAGTVDPDVVPVSAGSPVSSAPTLPNTGTNAAWPGAIGAALVLAGGGLLWVGRRRDDADVTAV